MADLPPERDHRRRLKKIPALCPPALSYALSSLSIAIIWKQK
jgi:hypothetical protein